MSDYEQRAALFHAETGLLAPDMQDKLEPGSLNYNKGAIPWRKWNDKRNLNKREYNLIWHNKIILVDAAGNIHQFSMDYVKTELEKQR